MLIVPPSLCVVVDAPPYPERTYRPTDRFMSRALPLAAKRLAALRAGANLRRGAMGTRAAGRAWAGVFVAEKVSERLPELSLHDLQLAWLRIMKNARLTQSHRVGREQLSVREHMTAILRKLGDGDFVVFEALFDVKLGAAGLVVSFLAVLELVKERLVEVSQNEAFAPIYVKLADASRDHT